MKTAPPLWFLSACLAAFLAGVIFYSAKLDHNAAWVADLGEFSESRLTARAFDVIADPSLQPALFSVENDADHNLALKLASCEEFWNASGAREAALRILCNTPYGQIVRNDVAAWNAASHLIAVRDNRAQDDLCQDPQARGDDEKRVYFPLGCKPARWRVYARLAGGAEAALTMLSDAAPPQDEFAAVFSGDIHSRYQSDWATVDAGADETADFTLRAEPFALERGHDVTVEVAGRLHGLDIGYRLGDASGRLHIEVGAAVGQGEGAAGGLRVIWRRACAQAPAALFDRVNATQAEAAQDEAGGADIAGGACPFEPPVGAGAPLAYEITFSYGGRAPPPEIADLTLAASPIALPLATLAAQRAHDRRARLARATGRAVLIGDFDYAANAFGHLSARCPGSPLGWGKDCVVSWTTHAVARHRERAAHIGVSLFDDPSTTLIDARSGRISETAFDLGLADIIGLDRADYGALLWTLAHKGGGDFKLSISEAMQRAVERVLYGGQAGCLRPRRGPADQLCLKLKPGFNTATLVLMDDEDARGEIRALASWPSLPKHSNIWDLQGMGAAHIASPGLGWRLLQPGQRPGSTFKAVTALAAAEAATGQGDAFPLSDAERGNLDRLLLGPLPISSPRDVDEVAFLGLGNCEGQSAPINGVTNLGDSPLGASHPRFPCVHNAGGSAFETEAELPAAGGCPAAGGPQRVKQMSVCEAIKYSSNLYFGGIGRLLTLADPNRATVALEDIARRLSFSDTPCGSPPAKAPRRCGFDLTRGLLGDSAAGRLRADPIAFDDRTGRQAAHRPRDAILSGFGDAQSATAVAMATVYASLGAGLLVRPSLTPLPRTRAGCPTKPAEGECAPAYPSSPPFDRLIDLVRKGMSAVVSRRGGTAAAYFKSTGGLVDRIYAKTGTATYRSRANPLDPGSKVERRFALWLAGWIEGDGGNGPLGHRLAFACAVTGGEKREVGADYCGPAIHDLLLALNGSAPR